MEYADLQWGWDTDHGVDNPVVTTTDSGVAGRVRTQHPRRESTLDRGSWVGIEIVGRVRGSESIRVKRKTRQLGVYGVGWTRTRF